MSEALDRAARVWNDMQRDPEMLNGLTMGDIEDLLLGIVELINSEDAVRRAIPFVLSLELTTATTVEQMAANAKALLRLPPVKLHLDQRAEA